MASLKKMTPLNMYKQVNTVYKENRGVLREFFTTKTLSELSNYTVLDLPDTKKKLLLEVILEKFRDRDGIPQPDEIALLLERPMVSANKELKGVLTKYLKQNFKGEYSAKRAAGYHNRAYEKVSSEYKHLLHPKNVSRTTSRNGKRSTSRSRSRSRGRAAAESPRLPNSFQARLALVNGNNVGRGLVHDVEAAEADLDQARHDGESLTPYTRHLEKVKAALKNHMSTRKRS